MTNPKLQTEESSRCGVSRRAFLGASTLGGTDLLATGWSALLRTTPGSAANADENAPWFEATIPQLQALMASGALTSRALTLAYLQRIDRLNPLLNAVIETNPNAVDIATQLDNKRRSGQLLGPLHGIPLLLKDNIATDDHLQTTAGSLALLHSRVPADAPLTSRLRSAGAVILGKANLSEWANFRGFAPCPSSWTCLNGWSGRGGFTQNPYILNWTACGSSSGSAVATATNLCAAAVGTETDGSVTCPASNNLIVGLKPTVGLVSQQGIIPIAHSQDTAGPMARTVTDVAILLGALQSPFGAVAGANLPQDYTQFLNRGALRGARIGVDRRFFTLDYGGEPPFDAVAEHAINVMRSLGATIVDPMDSGDLFSVGGPEFTVLLFEFKAQVAQYLASLSHTSIQAHQLDAIITPTWSGGTSLPAVAGYPNISVPVAIADDGRPAGIWMYSGFLQEPKLLALAYDLEQDIQPRVQPRFAGTPPDWADAGICASLPKSHDHGHVWKNKPLRPNWSPVMILAFTLGLSHHNTIGN